MASGALRVVVNDHEVKWQPSYQFPENEQFYDFKYVLNIAKMI